MADWQQYYGFSDDDREVRFLRADTPTPWMNYLSNGNFHVMLSQAGGGMVWYRSPLIWRITRYRFYNLPMDRPGPYLYLRDLDENAYWSLSAEPCAETPQIWSSAHGLGYTRFTSEHREIAATATYFVPPHADVLMQRVTLRNHSDRVRRVQLTGYVEFSMMEYLREVQWQCYIKHQVSVTYRKESAALLYHYGVNQQPKPAETPEVFYASDHPLSGWDGNRDQFIGSYRSEANPLGIEQGCHNSELIGGDPCGALQCMVELSPGEEREITFFLGVAPSAAEAAEILGALRQPGVIEQHWQALTRQWRDRLSVFQVSLPDADAQRQINTWNPYQVERNYCFSRSISYYALGFRGVGFRDTAQDIIAALQFDAPGARAKIRELLAQQYQDGHCNHMCFPIEQYPPVNVEYSDDHLWPILTVWSWIAETGDAGILDDLAPYFDTGDETVYQHLCRSLAFTESRLGAHGLPLMLAADWNDALCTVGREGKGESFWTAMLYSLALSKMAELAELTGDTATAEHCRRQRAQQMELVNDIGWDGAWYRRAIMDNGDFLGTREAPQARLFLNTQSWSVYAAMGSRDRQVAAMDAVAEQLDTPLGIKKVHPAVTDYPTPESPLFAYHPGLGENAAIFCHANTWAIIAECLLRRPERAWKYYRQLIPHVALQTAGIDRYMGEPYAYASNLFGPDSERFGLANVTWLTGTAAWMYLAATQYILGIRPELDGLRIDPCLPPEWPEISLTRDFRGCRYLITIRNPHGVGYGVGRLEVDGVPIDGTLLNHQADRTQCTVNVILGE